jgi:hypothetical protein
MSRFLSSLTPEEIASVVEPLFASTKAVNILFGNTIELGPKKVTAHMIDSPDEKLLHKRLHVVLEDMGAVFQYPRFIGTGHRAHVTQRGGIDFPPSTQIVCLTAYLIEVVNGRRVICAKFSLDKTK